MLGLELEVPERVTLIVLVREQGAKLVEAVQVGSLEKAPQKPP